MRLWLEAKAALSRRLKKRLPAQAWLLEHLQGGVVFTHPQAQPDKKRISGNTAAYGKAQGWVERLRRAPQVEGLTTDIQLAVLEAECQRPGKPAASAREEAERLYRQAADELRLAIEKPPLQKTDT